LGKALDAFLQGYMPDLVRIDRLILTHEDADHCGGAQQFISQWIRSNRSIREIWLPSIWAPAGAQPTRKNWLRSRIVKGAFEAAPEIARAAEKLAREQRTESLGLDRSSGDPFEDDLLMKAVRVAANESGALGHLFEVRQEEARAERLEAPLELQDSDEAWSPDAYRYLFGHDGEAVERHGLPLELTKLLIERGELSWSQAHHSAALELSFGVLETHPRIADTIAACVVFGIPIRWFDFDQFEKTGAAAGGDAEFLTPVNAIEVRLRPAPVSAKALFYALALSRANRECLAYLRHEEGSEPAVLFTGDSRLTTWGKAFPKPAAGLPQRRNLLATAMHHASEKNEAAYPILRNWLPGKYPPLFVRNGGHGVKVPAPSYLRVQERLCVRCIGSALPDVAVRVDAYGGRWRMPNHPRWCTCTAIR
jgi:hypothetical protein